MEGRHAFAFSGNAVAGPSSTGRNPAAALPNGGVRRSPSGNPGAAPTPPPAAAAAAAAAPVQPAGGGNVVRRTQNTILVSTTQKGNPVLTAVRNVAWEYSDIVPDYQVGATTGVLYLSLRYHLLHPEYIHGRIEKVGQAYSLRVLLVHCDADNHAASIRELTKVCIVNGYTMIVAWSVQEAGRYLEVYKHFEMKPPDLIKERIDDDYLSRLTSVLTTVKGVNKTDVITLASSFGSLKEMALASPEALTALPGMGEKKVKRLREAFTGNFVVKGSKKRKSAAEQAGEVGNSLN